MSSSRRGIGPDKKDKMVKTSVPHKQLDSEQFPRRSRDSRRTFSPTQRNEILHQQNNRCANCQKQLDPRDTHFDHKKPWADRGRTIIANGRALCGSCHNIITHEERLRRVDVKREPKTERTEDVRTREFASRVPFPVARISTGEETAAITPEVEQMLQAAIEKEMKQSNEREEKVKKTEQEISSSEFEESLGDLKKPDLLELPEVKKQTIMQLDRKLRKDGFAGGDSKESDEPNRTRQRHRERTPRLDP